MKDIFINQINQFKDKLYSLKSDVSVNEMPFILGEAYNDLFYYQNSLKPKIEHLFRTVVINGLLKRLFSSNEIIVEWQNNVNENESNSNSGLEFITIRKDKKVGYMYYDFIDESIFDTYDVDEIYVLDWKSYIRSKTVEKNYTNNRVHYLRVYDFVKTFFGEELFYDFVSYLNNVECEIDEMLGIATISTMSKKNYHLFRIDETENLKGTIEKLYCYTQIKNKIPDLEEKSRHLLIDRQCKNEFINKKYYMIFTGENEISRSFLTSEFLYNSYKYVEWFDSTCIVSGYLKSVEQLLYRLCLEHCNAGLKIKYDKNKYKNKIKRTTRKEPVCDKKIELNVDNLDCVDSTYDSLIDFLTNNENYKHTLLCTKNEKKVLQDCLNRYRTECRNSHFHKDVITKWGKVE